MIFRIKNKDSSHTITNNSRKNFRTAVIELTKGLSTIIDSEDLDKVISQGSWHVQIKPNGKMYAIGHTIKGGKRTTRRLHRVILNAKVNEQVDHINGNGLDNRKSNLRLTNALGNARNRKPDKKVLYKGVRISSINKKTTDVTYIARICKNNRKSEVIGYYKDLDQAIEAYDLKAIEYFGEFAYTNKPRSYYEIK